MKTLLGIGLLVELLSKKFVYIIKPWPAIQKDGYICVSFENNSVTILDKYVIIPINVKKVKTVIKTWLVNIEVYNLFLGITWIRQANYIQMFDEKKVTIKRNNQNFYVILA